MWGRQINSWISIVESISINSPCNLASFIISEKQALLTSVFSEACFPTGRGVARISFRRGPNFQGSQGQSLQKEKSHRIWPTIFKGPILIFFFKNRNKKYGLPGSNFFFSGDPRWPPPKPKNSSYLTSPFFRGLDLQKKKKKQIRCPPGGGFSPKILSFHYASAHRFYVFSAGLFFLPA